MSSEIENILTTNDELYQAFSSQKKNTDPATNEVLHYQESLLRRKIKKPAFIEDCGLLLYFEMNVVELEGIEPSSIQRIHMLSTMLSVELFFEKKLAEHIPIFFLSYLFSHFITEARNETSSTLMMLCCYPVEQGRQRAKGTQSNGLSSQSVGVVAI